MSAGTSNALPRILFGTMDEETTKISNTKQMRRHLSCQQFNGNGSRLHNPKAVVMVDLMRKPASDF